jgi:hypothetical protein
MSVNTEETTRSDAHERAQMTVERGLNFFSQQHDLLGHVEQLQRTKFLPEQIIERYLHEALKAAEVKRLDGGETSLPKSPGFRVCGLLLRTLLHAASNYVKRCSTGSFSRSNRTIATFP